MITTCGIFLYSIVQDKILVCHATNTPWKKWTIPKGRQNDNEDFFNTAVRELEEETGVKLQDLKVLKIYSLPTVEYQTKLKTLVSFLVITSTDLTDFSFFCNSYTENKMPEMDNWKWISIDQISEYLHESQQKNLELIKEILKNKTFEK